MHIGKSEGRGYKWKLLICENADAVDFLVKRGMRFDDALEYINKEAGLTISNNDEKEGDMDILILIIHSLECSNMYATIFISPTKKQI